MNWDRIEGNWKELKGQAREKWGRLTNDELDIIAGRREQLEGTLQRVYGKSRDEVQREVDDFCKSCSGRD
jgi:uncharacterized protein YjbJ (UPF0337 family)